MLTAEQIAQNRAAAMNAVRTQLGLSDVPSDWTYEQRALYNKTLAAYIAARPEQFSQVDLNTANLVSQTTYTPLEDAKFDWGMFAVETVKPAGDALSSIGNGVLTVANAAKWAIPLLALAGVGLLFLSANKRLGGVVPGIKS